MNDIGMNVNKEGNAQAGLGWILPRVIVALLLLDLGLRFFPLDPLCIRGWECMIRYQEPGAIFEANKKFVSPRTYGNLANMGNLPQWRQYRSQTFTTDQNGFRNSGSQGSAPSPILMIGDSFVAGDGVSDEETLPVQLAEVTGLDFYNAGGPYAYLKTVKLLREKLGLSGGRVLVVHTENLPVEFLIAARERSPDWKSVILGWFIGQNAEYFREWLRGWWYFSPLKIAAEKAYVRLRNGLFLPNIFADNVVRARLKNGTGMLFTPDEVKAFHRHREINDVAVYYQWLAEELRKDGFDLMVVLVPSKYSVYFSLLEGFRAVPGDAVHPLARLETTLRAKGVPVLDLTSSYRVHAVHAFASGEYLYWLDDTHWNRLGIRLAAETIQQTWYSDLHGAGHHRFDDSLIREGL